MKLPLSVIVLTKDEENNIRACLESVSGWADEIFVVDSHSTDRTLEIAEEFPAKIVKHPFTNYSHQRNWSQENLPIKNEWIFHLDAGERVTPELVASLEKFFQSPPADIDGLMMPRRTIFMGQWIRYGGHYPVYHLRIYRKDRGRCEDRLYDQHFLVEGKTQKISGDLIDIQSDSLASFTIRHNRWAAAEAVQQLRGPSSTSSSVVAPRLQGNPIERRRFLRKFYSRWPLFMRPFLYFIYRYFFKFGFLDGRVGLIWHFLQGFWYRFLVDAKIYELRQRAKKENRPLEELLDELEQKNFLE